MTDPGRLSASLGVRSGIGGVARRGSLRSSDPGDLRTGPFPARTSDTVPSMKSLSVLRRTMLSISVASAVAAAAAGCGSSSTSEPTASDTTKSAKATTAAADIDQPLSLEEIAEARSEPLAGCGSFGWDAATRELRRRGVTGYAMTYCHNGTLDSVWVGESHDAAQAATLVREDVFFDDPRIVASGEIESHGDARCMRFANAGEPKTACVIPIGRFVVSTIGEKNVDSNSLVDAIAPLVPWLSDTVKIR